MGSPGLGEWPWRPWPLVFTTPCWLPSCAAYFLHTSHGEKGSCLWFLLISFICIINYGLQMITKSWRLEFFHQPYKYVVLFIWVLVYDHVCWISSRFVFSLHTSGKMGDHHVCNCFLNHVVLDPLPTYSRLIVYLVSIVSLFLLLLQWW